MILAFTSLTFESVYISFVSESGKLAAKFLFVLLFEHVVFGLVYLLEYLIPNIPHNVDNAIKREAYIQRLLSGIEES
jgi:hypothetical protein